jgi:hypothetical protein
LVYDVPDDGFQGGMNESVLTLDFKALSSSVQTKDRTKQQLFPLGDDTIWPHILANMEAVEEGVVFRQVLV